MYPKQELSLKLIDCKIFKIETIFKELAFDSQYDCTVCTVMFTFIYNSYSATVCTVW